MNLHSKICLHTSVCSSHLKCLERQIFTNGGSSTVYTPRAGIIWIQVAGHQMAPHVLLTHCTKQENSSPMSTSNPDPRRRLLNTLPEATRQPPVDLVLRLCFFFMITLRLWLTRRLESSVAAPPWPSPRMDLYRFSSRFVVLLRSARPFLRPRRGR